MARQNQEGETHFVRRTANDENRLLEPILIPDDKYEVYLETLGPTEWEDEPDLGDLVSSVPSEATGGVGAPTSTTAPSSAPTMSPSTLDGAATGAPTVMSTTTTKAPTATTPTASAPTSSPIATPSGGVPTAGDPTGSDPTGGGPTGGGPTGVDTIGEEHHNGSGW
jgi:hypothetical protein